MKKASENAETKKEQIKTMLKQLRSKTEVAKIKKHGKVILKNMTPTDLALIEQEMIKEGITRTEGRKLCDVHLEVMKDSLGRVNVRVKAGHPIHTLMEEHKAILDFLDKLNHTVASLKSSRNFKEVDNEVRMLEHIAEHLVEADKHHQREEEVLFPVMERLGVTEPPEVMREEHHDLKPRKAELYKIAKKNGKIAYPAFVKKVSEIAGYLKEELPKHIYKEDNILYPMALKIIPRGEWAEIRKKCDKIGYCCFTPALR